MLSMVFEIIMIVLKLAGALGMFMYGMEKTSEGIQRAAGNRLQRAVNFMTKNSAFAILTGIVVTILVQSSSAATVMVVSFVNAGLLSLIQAIGVIMGSNIGTTVTAWLKPLVKELTGVSSWSIVGLAIPIFGIGYFMSIMKKRSESFRSYGMMLMGFALIFLGLEFMGEAIPDPSKEALNFLQGFSQMGWIAVIACFFIGIVFTMLVNASSATIVITQGLTIAGYIDFPMAVALVLGANIGTTFDSFLVSLGGNTNAKRAAWSHILFNVFGSLWVLVLFYPFLWLVEAVVPGEYSNANSASYVAMAHTLFNMVNTILLFPLIKPYARLVSWIIKGKPEKERPFSLAYTVQNLSPNPDLNLIYARKEISDMADLSSQMFARFVGTLKKAPENWDEELEDFKAMEGYADQMRDELAAFLFQTQSQHPSDKGQEQIAIMMRMMNELETITDDCYRLAILIGKSKGMDQRLDEGAIGELSPYTALVSEALEFAKKNINATIDSDQLAIAEGFETRIDEFKSQLKKTARKRLQAGAAVKAELLYMDIIRHIEKIGDHAYAISNALRELAS